MGISEEMQETGRRIRAARAYAGLNVQELAAEVGCDRNSVWRWEKGLLPRDERRREDILRRIAEVIDLEVAR